MAPKGLFLAVYVALADNVLGSLSAATDGVEAASSSAGVPSLATALFTRAMAWGESFPVRPLAAREAPLVDSTRFIRSVA
jgi:hypothetical protein